MKGEFMFSQVRVAAGEIAKAGTKHYRPPHIPHLEKVVQCVGLVHGVDTVYHLGVSVEA